MTIKDIKKLDEAIKKLSSVTDELLENVKKINDALKVNAEERDE